MSLAMLFEYSLNLNNVSDLIETAVSNTLNAGFRTQDINKDGKGTIVSCSGMGDEILRNIDEIKSEFIR
jgi:3-isopropylmalate dehydrogenase